MYSVEVVPLERTFLDKLFGRVRYIWAGALCSPNDEWDSKVGRDLVKSRLARLQKDPRDYVPGRSGRITIKNDEFSSVGALLKAEALLWQYRSSRNASQE